MELAATLSPSSITPTKVSQETIESAVSALLKWKSAKSSTQNSQLLPSDDFIYLVLTFHKIPPKSRTNAYKIPLPNPLFSSFDSTEFCLFLDDRHVSSRSAKDKILEEKIPVAKVIKFSKLKTDYKPFEAKRKLCDSYDMFFADKRIIPLLPRIIGKQFYKKKKIPVPIELGRKNWKEQIDRVCGSALFFVSTGSCSVLKVARASMSKEEIVENVLGAINGVIEFVPKKWRNVRSLHLKFAESVALPVFQAVPEIKMKFGGGAVAVVRDEEVLESDKGEKNEKRKKKSNVGKNKKGRIHEVKYMDDVVGDDESGSEDDDNEELGSVEVSVKKRKNASNDKEDVKKVAKVKKGDKGLKTKKEKVVKKLDTEMGSAEIADVKKVEVKKTMKVKKGDVGLKQKKEKALGKSVVSDKKTKRSKVAAAV